MHTHAWWCHSLADIPHASLLLTAIDAALQAVDPAKAVCHALQSYAYSRPIQLIGVGKAVLPMAQAVLYDCALPVQGGCLIMQRGSQMPVFPATLAVHESDHPLPTQAALAATQALQLFIARLQPHDQVLLLLSGGASVLATAPKPPLTLADLYALNLVLVHSGLPIDAMNCVRKHCEDFKGGQLAAAIPAPLDTLILSDVIGSPLDVIASGMTAPDPTTYLQAAAIIAPWRWQLPVIWHYLQRGVAGDLPETPKPGALCFEQVTNTVVADNRLALLAAAQVFHDHQWHVDVAQIPYTGEASMVGRAIARRLLNPALPRPYVYVNGGESIVTIKHASIAHGQGGRNQELALAAAHELAGHERVALLTIATDGADGATPAAGALATGTTIARAQAAGLDAQQALLNHQAYPLWASLNDAFCPGLTQTNVNDLLIGIRW